MADVISSFGALSTSCGCYFDPICSDQPRISRLAVCCQRAAERTNHLRRRWRNSQPLLSTLELLTDASQTQSQSPILLSVRSNFNSTATFNTSDDPLNPRQFSNPQLNMTLMPSVTQIQRCSISISFCLNHQLNNQWLTDRLIDSQSRTDRASCVNGYGAGNVELVPPPLPPTPPPLRQVNNFQSDDNNPIKWMTTND